MRQPSSPPSGLLLVAGIVLVVIVVIWFFLLRGGGQPSEFMRAYERIVAAEAATEAALGKVTRFVQVEAFHGEVQKQIDVLNAQLAVLERIASENDGDTGRLAAQAAEAAERVATYAASYLDAMLVYELDRVTVSISEMNGGIATLEQVAAEWESLE